MSTHNICFHGEKKNNAIRFSALSGLLSPLKVYQVLLLSHDSVYIDGFVQYRARQCFLHYG